MVSLAREAVEVRTAIKRPAEKKWVIITPIDGKRTLSVAGRLLREGELVTDAEDVLRPNNRHWMTSDPRGADLRQRQFLKSGLGEATQVFEQRYPHGAAKFLSLLLSCPRGSLPALFSELRSAAESAAMKYDVAPDEAPET